jgi:hypothetical protein
MPEKMKHSPQTIIPERELTEEEQKNLLDFLEECDMDEFEIVEKKVYRYDILTG